MANNEKIPYFCRVVLQNFPFIEEDFDALTTYQLISKVVEYLNKVIRSQNILVDNVNNLSTAFQQLHDYVENYFENLDVQEEINNKLDQMAEDGTLQEIITAYIQANVAWCFDSVADMQSATNLVAGSYAQTLGYYAVNDGGGALYKITDTADESVHQETVGNLYATLIVDEYVDIRQLGAKGDSSLDNTTIIQEAVDKYDKVKIVDGTYIVSDIITLNTGNKLAGNGILKTKPAIALTVDLGNMFLLQEVDNISIDGLTFDGNKDNVPYVYDNYHKAFYIIDCENISFSGCKFINFHHQAVQVASVRVGAADETKPGVKNLDVINCTADHTLCLLQVTNSISSGINVYGCTATNLGEHGIVFYKNINNINIENCLIDTTGLGGGASSTGHGIRLYKNTNVKIVNNKVYNTFGNGITGVVEDTCDNVTIVGNIIDTVGTANDGIYYHGNNSTIENNKISNITERGIYLIGDNNIVTGNRINTVKTGCISDGDNNTLSFNIIDTTTYRGMNIQNSDKTYILGNRYSNTTDYACYIANTCTNSKITNNFGTISNRGTLLADDVQ